MSLIRPGKFSKFQPVVRYISFILQIMPLFVSRTLFRMSANWRSNIGVGIRYCCLKRLAKSVGNNVFIGSGVFFFAVENLVVGDNVSIHPMCYIDASGGLSIGDNVSIAHSTTIVTANHTWSIEREPIKYNPVVLEPVTIEDDVWIGCGVRVLSGVLINKRSVIAAGSVVNKNVCSNSLVGGVPAKLIKYI